MQVAWGTETYFEGLCHLFCVICNFDHTWKSNYMLIIVTGTSRVKIMVERGNNFEPTCSVIVRWKGI